MARQKTQLCPSCHTLFKGRVDARTCSARCRKRLQRATDSLHQKLLANRTVAEISAMPSKLLAYQFSPVRKEAK